jgi:phosphate:Na+ symporter
MIARLLQVFGGLALFLLGVNMLSKGMEKLAGNKIQDWLDRMTSTHIKGGIFGTVATALLQSSSMVMVTMISLINAKLMTLEQAISVMLGQEIGTTLTGQIAAFKMGDFFFIFLIAGLIILEFTKKGEWKKYGEILMGFGILFLGMQTMTSALKVLMDLPAVVNVMAYMGQHVMLSVLAGTIATAIVQSSSAVTGLVVAMGLSGSVTLPCAVGLLLGANIGTCFTGLMAASRLSKASLQASMAQIFINVVGVLVFLPFIHPFSNLVALTAPQLGRQIANAHTIFNITVSLMMYPFVGLIKKLVMKVIPIVGEENGRLTHYIDEGQLSVPSIALNEAFRELLLLKEECIAMVSKAAAALLDYDKVAVKWVLDKEENYIDPVVDQLDMFVNHLYLTDLDESQQRRAFQIKSLIVDVERIADLAENLAESAREKQKKDIDFSKYGDRSIKELSEYIVASLQLTHDALKGQDTVKARLVIEREDEFDHLYMKARQRHIVRLKKKICKPNAEVIFLETLHNFERISDHTENIAEKIIDQNAPAVAPVPAAAV